MPIFLFGWVLYRPWTKNQLEHLEGVKNLSWHLSREMFLILKNYDKDQVQSDFQGPKAKKGQKRWVFIGSYIINQVEHQERLLSVELSSDLENLQVWMLDADWSKSYLAGQSETSKFVSQIWLFTMMAAVAFRVSV